MSALDQLFALLETTEVMQHVVSSIKEEPAHLLGEVCREYQRTGQPLADYHLQFIGFMGEASLRALISAGLITRQPGGRVAIYSFAPTEEGLRYYQYLRAEGFYRR